MGEDRHDEAVSLALANLAFDPSSAWHHVQASFAHHEERRYASALRHALRAAALQPDDPLVLWALANTLDHNDRDEEALAIFKRLLRRGERRVGLEDCTEGIGWARSLLNDCRYRIGLCYRDLGRPELARRWLREHLEHRRPGQRSIYALPLVRRKLRELEGI